MFLFCFTKILNQAFYMTHTFDSEVSLHYWLLWPTMWLVVCYRTLTTFDSQPSTSIFTEGWGNLDTTSNSVVAKSVFMMLQKSFISLLIESLPVRHIRILASKCIQYTDKKCTVRPRDTRPQDARTLTMHVFEQDPKTLEMHVFARFCTFFGKLELEMHVFWSIST